MENELLELIKNNDWYRISCFQFLTEEFIEKYQNKVNWIAISCNQKLSEEFIEKFQDKISWLAILYSQKLSEEFIEKFQDKVDWWVISYNQKLSEEFIEKFQDKLYFECMNNHIFRKNCYWCERELKIIKFKNKRMSYCPNCLR